MELLIPLLDMSIPSFTGAIAFGLLFADGLVFGVAGKKAFSAIAFIVVGLILAALLSLSIPFFDIGQISNHVLAILESDFTKSGSVLFAMPAVWIIGFVIGLVKG
jgi:hypothetical protein